MKKALISDLTYRSLEMQKERFKGMPIFTAPQDIPTLLRNTRRSGELDIHVISFGVIAAKEKDVIDFGKLCKQRQANVSSHEDAFTWTHTNKVSLLVSMWRAARSLSAGKIGARISADKKKQESQEKAAKIAGRWPLPSDEYPTEKLLREAGLSYNTAKSILGRRPIEQANYQASKTRKARKGKK